MRRRLATPPVKPFGWAAAEQNQCVTGKERDPETGLDYFGARYDMSALGRWAMVDPVAEKFPGWTPYNYTLNDPVALVDPDGTETVTLEGAAAQSFFRQLQSPDDIFYDEHGKEIKEMRVKNDQPDRHFLVLNGEKYRLDNPLEEGARPYDIHRDPAEFDATATALTEGAPKLGLRGIYQESQEGGRLDFKRKLPDRSLWNAGDGLYTHKDKVGNTAWGYYMSGEGVPLWLATLGASYQAGMVGRRAGEAEDQKFIERGYRLRRK